MIVIIQSTPAVEVDWSHLDTPNCLLRTALADQRIQNEEIEILASYIDTVNFIHWLRSSEITWVQKLRLHEIDFTEYCLKK